MGLKMSFAVLRADQPDAAFAAGSVHDPNAAERVAPMLLPDCEPVGTAALGDAMYGDRLMNGRVIREFGTVSESGEVWIDRGERSDVELPFWSRDRWPELSDEEWETVSVFPFSTESFGDAVIGDLAFGASLTRLPRHVYELPVTVFDSDAAAVRRAVREAEIAANVRRSKIRPLDLDALANRRDGADRQGGGHE